MTVTYQADRLAANSMRELADMQRAGEFKAATTVGSYDPRQSNNARAAFAVASLVAFAERTGDFEEFETVMGDLLGDLHHLADALDIDWDFVSGRGERYYTQEVAGEL